MEESDIPQQRRLLHPQVNSGLTRYQSAPSSYFTTLVDRKFCDQFVGTPSSPETERIFARFMTSGSEIARESNRTTQYFSPTVKTEAADAIQKQSDIDKYTAASASHILHQNQWKPPLPNKSINSSTEATFSMEMGGLTPMRIGSNHRLLRQSSSPAELLSHMSVERGFPFECWDESSMLSAGVNMSESENGALGRQSSSSSPYPKAGGGAGGAVQLPDSVACRIRAKRGCATHPRSIAERVRRTRISERMRKLQQLVPNMDRQQANTSEMLDLAIDYIKALQKQVQTLSKNDQNCRCSNKQLQQV